MGYGNHCISSPRVCFLTQDYNEWMNKHYPNSEDDDEKIIRKRFYSDECVKFIEFVDNKCSNHRSQRLLVTCNYCQNDFKTFCNRALRCSSGCRLIERKLKTYTFEKLKRII